MKVPLSWLKEWIEFDAAPEALADALTRRGFYVEGIETHGGDFPGVVVARVIEAQRHPNADRLSLCRVDGGSGELSVVCGAPNVRTGMVVPLATVGAKLPGGLTIRKSKIRGETSEGMLCSAQELELSQDHQGIVDLEAMFPGRDDLTAGRPLAELMPPPETVFEIEIPFNRPDTLGVIGVAREVKAALGGTWTAAGRARLDDAWQGGSDDFDLALEDTEGCPSYIAQVIENVTIGPSPDWMQRRLESVGQRPINNVVDVTNWVLFEYGQPLHAFDLDRLAGPAIRVRRAKAGERFTTLDGKVRELDSELLMIDDANGHVAVAGVMGGADSEVHDGTKRLLLECAWFDPRRVRRGARYLGLSSEASKRYERGVDPEIGPRAAQRFITLLQSICPALTLGASRRVRQGEAASRTLTLRASRATRLVGARFDAEACARQLNAFEFRVSGSDPMRVEVPSWRPDVTEEDDLVEEVARGWGYDRIPEAPLETGGTYAVRTARERLVTQARTAMQARGFMEAWCSTLVSGREAETCVQLLGDNPATLVRLANPMSREHEVLRPNLLPGLLRAAAHNLKQGSAAVRLYEVGHGFASRGGPLPEETLSLAAVVCGPRYAHAHDASQQTCDFDDARGLWDAWLEELRVDTPEWRAYAALGWKPGASAEVASGTSRIGWAGTLGQAMLKAWDIEVPLHVFVVQLDGLEARTPGPGALRLPGRFPSVRRDVAFFVDEKVTHRELERTLVEHAGAQLERIELFDIYSGPGTPEGTRSLAYALQFQHPERTLTEAEVQTIQDRMVTAVTKEHGGRLRER
jgi:phenylalanyl-tRNA synthetase beta chain